jgi:hypothetical protein
MTSQQFFAGGASSRSTRVRSGNHRIHKPTTSSVPRPPITTDGTTPNHAAVTPDSNSPNWFDVPMKSALTADTRPRIASGVCNCTSDERTTTLTMSAAPMSARAASESTNERDTPNTIVRSPNSATAPNIRRPARRVIGLRAR